MNEVLLRIGSNHNQPHYLNPFWKCTFIGTHLFFNDYNMIAMDIANSKSGNWCTYNGINAGYHCSTYQSVHAAAVLALGLSIFASLLSLYTIVWTRRKEDGPLKSRKLVERIIFYMALCDFLYAACHISSHIHNLVDADGPTYNECVLYGTVVSLLVFVQACLVWMMSLNALLMTVYQRVLAFGPYDCGLFVFVGGGSAALAVTGIKFEGFGQDKAW